MLRSHGLLTFQGGDGPARPDPPGTGTTVSASLHRDEYQLLADTVHQNRRVTAELEFRRARTSFSVPPISV